MVCRASRLFIAASRIALDVGAPRIALAFALAWCWCVSRHCMWHCGIAALRAALCHGIVSRHCVVALNRGFSLRGASRLLPLRSLPPLLLRSLQPLRCARRCTDCTWHVVHCRAAAVLAGALANGCCYADCCARRYTCAASLDRCVCCFTRCCPHCCACCCTCCCAHYHHCLCTRYSPCCCACCCANCTCHGSAPVMSLLLRLLLLCLLLLCSLLLHLLRCSHGVVAALRCIASQHCVAVLHITLRHCVVVLCRAWCCIACC